MSVQKRTTKTGKPRWVARYRDKTGREHSRSFDTQRKADESTAEEIGKLYANAIRLTPPDWADGVSYVIVEDGTGTHIHQTRVER